VPGQHCKTQSEPTITGIFRHDGSEIQNALAFFAGGKVTETFYNRYGAVINNPLAYAAKTLQFSTKNFKGKIKGKGKASGKLRDQIHGQKGSKTDQNDYECGHWRDTWADVWADAEQVWQEASDPWPKIDPRKKGHAPIGSKGHPGKGKGKDRPDPPDRKGSGRGSSTHSNSHPPHKNIGQSKSSRPDKRPRRHRRGSSEPDDYIDVETISCAEYNEQCVGSRPSPRTRLKHGSTSNKCSGSSKEHHFHSNGPCPPSLPSMEVPTSTPCITSNVLKLGNR